MRWRSASRPSSVIFGKLRSIVLSRHGPFPLHFLGAKNLAIDLAGRRLGQLGHELDEARILVLAEALAHQILDLAREVAVAAAFATTKAFTTCPRSASGTPIAPDLAHVGMLQHARPRSRWRSWSSRPR